MPMGYKNSPLIFQRIMNHELREWLGRGVDVYLDDIIIYAKDEITHDKTLREVATKLQQANLKINIEKIQFKKRSSRIPRPYCRWRKDFNAN